MTKTSKRLGLVLLALLVIVDIGLHFTNKPVNAVDTNKIDSLQQIIDSIKIKQDTILVEIRIRDTIIKNAKEQYKKDSTVIATQSISDDIEFFSNYLSTLNQ